MRRRDFITLLGGAAATWPLVARAQQPAMPMVVFLSGASRGSYAPFVSAFHNGLKEAGYVEGQNVAIEYRWAEGHYDRLLKLAVDLVPRRVSRLIADEDSNAGHEALIKRSRRPDMPGMSVQALTRG